MTMYIEKNSTSKNRKNKRFANTRNAVLKFFGVPNETELIKLLNRKYDLPNTGLNFDDLEIWIKLYDFSRYIQSGGSKL